MAGYYRVKFGYLSDEPDILSFEEGDVVHVSVVDDNGWWKGICLTDSVEGWFPGSYVEPVRAGGGCYVGCRVAIVLMTGRWTPVRPARCRARERHAGRRFTAARGRRRHSRGRCRRASAAAAAAHGARRHRCTAAAAAARR
jgi:hypothetical protein